MWILKQMYLKLRYGIEFSWRFSYYVYAFSCFKSTNVLDSLIDVKKYFCTQL